LYCRFGLSFRDTEDLLAQRGISVPYESIRRWDGDRVILDVRLVGDESTAADVIWGAVYEIATAEKPQLDHAEGLGRGYVDKMVWVESTGGSISATTYVASPELSNLISIPTLGTRTSCSQERSNMICTRIRRRDSSGCVRPRSERGSSGGAGES
jgi:hypothetical protein